MGCFSSVLATQSNENYTEISDIEDVKRYTYKELQIATQGFSLSNRKRLGAFGPVYKGKLRNGTLAAIYMLSENSYLGVPEFLTEIEVITAIEHENLVKLYGCCVEGNHRIMVYGYLENNSVAKTLLGGGHSSIQSSWPVRRNICIGVARGVAYLHLAHIVHGDIKASNILLDKDLQPKISDFGVGKFISVDLTQDMAVVYHRNDYLYLAPENLGLNQVTKKSDVYYFGVLLMEIVSGRSNKNSQLPAREQHLLPMAWNMHNSNKLEELVDGMLKEDLDIEEACRFFTVALLCTQKCPELRPSMSIVLNMLTGEIDVNDEITKLKPGFLFKVEDNGKNEGEQKAAAEVDQASSSSVSREQ